MIKLNEMRRRVRTRKRELDSQSASISELKNKLTAFVEDVRNRSVIYNLIKTLPVWQEIEKLIKADD